MPDGPTVTAGQYTVGSRSGDPSVRLGGTCCVISHKSFYRVDGRYCSAGGFNKYIEVISGIYDSIILAVPVGQGRAPEGLSPLLAPGVTFAPLPLYEHRFFLQSLIHPLGFGRPLIKAIRQADIVHTILPGYIQFAGLVLAQLMRKPVYSRIAGDWEGALETSRFAQAHQRTTRVIVWVHRRMVRHILRSGLVFACGDALTAEYRKHGTNVHPDYPSTFSESDILSPDALSPMRRPPRVLFVGRLDYRKGVPYLLAAMQLLRQRGVSARLVLVGTGPNGREFMDSAKTLGIDDIVDFRGHVAMGEDLWRVFREHDVLVLPSLLESMGKVLLEAYANGLPVVATRVGGIPGIVSDRNGILVPPCDDVALADAIERIVTNDDYRLELARFNLEYAKGKTMEAQARQLSTQVRLSFPSLFPR